mmetsp:Transcript_67142/g.194119  ORF Transcript_67142/g.194119 Transcript_67142/m.194119 type:complete len:214 (+) Transcript_67142:3299-3940(+)
MPREIAVARESEIAVAGGPKIFVARSSAIAVSRGAEVARAASTEEQRATLNHRQPRAHARHLRRRHGHGPGWRRARRRDRRDEELLDRAVRGGRPMDRYYPWTLPASKAAHAEADAGHLHGDDGFSHCRRARGRQRLCVGRLGVVHAAAPSVLRPQGAGWLHHLLPGHRLHRHRRWLPEPRGGVVRLRRSRVDMRGLPLAADRAIARRGGAGR